MYRSLIFVLLFPMPFSLSALAGDEVGLSAYPLTVPMAGGEALTLEKRPERICSVVLAADEILIELAGPERILALSTFVDDPKYSNIVQEASGIQRRVSSNAEAVIFLKPDLVFVAAYSSPEFLELLKRARLPAYRFPLPESLEDIRRMIGSVGVLIGEATRAENLVQEMGREIEAVAQAVSAASRPGVLAYSYGYVAGSDTLAGEIITRSGGRNLAAERGIQGHQRIDPEMLLVWDPDYLLIEGPAAALTHGERLLATETVLSHLGAIRQGRVIEVPPPWLSAASHHIVKGIRETARLLHPECFGKE